MQEQSNWQDDLLENGFTRITDVLTKNTCDNLIDGYDDDIYRSVINMQRYNFGRGEYKYFAYPLPEIIHSLRNYFYNTLQPVATEWAKRL